METDLPEARVDDRSARRTARAWAVVVVVLTCALVTPGGALAQGLDFLSSGSGPLDGTLAEHEEVLGRLDAAFVRAQVERLATAREQAGDALVEFEASAPLARARDDFLAAAGRELFALEGDGSLTLGEVAEALPPIRERHLRRFEDVVEALSLGHPPPPVRPDFDDLLSYLLAQTRYTLLTRNPPADWGRLAACAAAGMLLALLLSRSLHALSRRVTRLEHRALGSALDSIRMPLILAAAAGGLLVGLRFLWLPTAAEEVIRTTLSIAIVGFAFLGCWNLADELAGVIARGVRRATGRQSVEHLRRVVQRALSVLVVVAFLVIVSRFVLGVSLSGLLAGLGVAGVGLWFLTRGLVENVAASFTLFGDRVFRVGDTVIHDGEWGTIEDIGFRSTRCRTFDGHLMHIPNRNLLDDTVRNVSARPYLRSRFRLSLVYDTPPAKLDEALDIVRSVIDERGDAVNRDEGVNVVFDAFGAHDLQLLVQYYTATDDYWTAKGTMGAVNRALLHRFEEAGIAFAFPTQTTLLGGAGDEPLALSLEETEGDREGARDATERTGDEPADGTAGAKGESRGDGRSGRDGDREGVSSTSRDNTSDERTDRHRDAIDEEAVGEDTDGEDDGGGDRG